MRAVQATIRIVAACAALTSCGGRSGLSGEPDGADGIDSRTDPGEETPLDVPDAMDVGEEDASDPFMDWETPATCGDGAIDPEEECDDGNGVDWDGCTRCMITEFQVNTYVEGGQVIPRVDIAGDASFVVVWEAYHEDRGHWGILGQRYDVDGSRIGSEFQVNERILDEQGGPSVAVTGDGSFVIVWYEYDDLVMTGNIRSRRYDPSGTPVGDEFSVGMYGGGWLAFSDIAMSSDGRFVVVWMGDYYDGLDTCIHGRRFDATGLPLGPEFRVNTSTEGDQRFPEVGMAADGRFVVTWDSYSFHDSTASVHAQRFDAAGRAEGVELRLGALAPHTQWKPAACMIADGRSLIGWQEAAGSDHPVSDIGCQLFDASGEAVGPAFQPHSNTGDLRVFVAVAMAGDGRLVVAWSRGHHMSDDWNTYVRLFDETGEPLSSEFRVNVFPVGGQAYVNAAMAPDGRFVLVWHSEEQDGDGLGVFAQRFTADGEPRGVLPW